VKHIIVNGAFNHGNSGGALLVAHKSEVVGIVVLTFNFYPPQLKSIIDGLTSQKFGLMVGQVTNPDGTIRQVSEAEITGAVLQEFYEKTQVVIGEAVASSELEAMLREHATELK
jgi:S1-C subfamily serine protease